MKRIFLDANIPIDVFTQNPENFRSCAQIISLGELGRFNLYCAAFTFHILDYVLTRRSGRNVAIANLSKLLQVCSVVDTDYSVIHSALQSNWKDTEDAMQYFSAIKTNADCIISSDKKDFRKSSVPIYTPLEFLKKI